MELKSTPPELKDKPHLMTPQERQELISSQPWMSLREMTEQVNRSRVACGLPPKPLPPHDEPEES